MKTDLWASGNQFFPFSQTAVNTTGSSFSFNQNILETWKRSFYLFFVYCLISSFFCKWKLLLKLGGSQFFNDKPYSCQWTPFFQFFRDFLKWKQLFCIVETYSSIFFTCLVVIFFTCLSAISLSRNHYWYKEKTVLREKAHSCQQATVFLASGNHFSETPAIFFQSSGKLFFKEILIFGQ